MDTGQLFMQSSARSKVDFLMPVSASTTSKPTMKKEAGTFDGVLKEVAPQRHSKIEQSTRTEVKRPLLKNVERADEPDKQQPREVQNTSRNREMISDYDKKTDVEKNQEPKMSVVPDVITILQNLDTNAEIKPEMKLPEISNLTTIPQNVETSAAVTMITFTQLLAEGRMPQTVATEDNVSKIDGLVRAQNAIPELQLPEGKTPEVLQANAKLDISEENAGTSAALSLPVEDDTEILAAKSQLPPEPLSENADSKVVLMQQPAILQDEMTSQDIKATEMMVRQLPLTSVIAAKQNMAGEGQSVTTKMDSDSITVEEVNQQSVKPAFAKQKEVTSQELLKSLPFDGSVEASLQNRNEVLLQTSVRSQVSSTTSEFKFSRSASVEASLGMVSVVIEQPAERLSISVSDSAKAATVNSVIESVSAEFSGSGSGFMGKDAEGFGQQNLDLPKPGLQQMTNGQAVSSTNISNGNVEQSAPQQSLMASSENVAGQVKTQLSTREIKQGAEQITIQLSPDHLGDIKVNFRLEDQRLRVEIVAENRSARESLLLHADSLKESLARQNINMEKFEVTGGNNGSASQGGNAQPEWREMARNRQSQQWLSSGGYRTQSAELNTPLPVYFARAENSTLDLHF